jgi:hypothetical protein
MLTPGHRAGPDRPGGMHTVSRCRCRGGKRAAFAEVGHRHRGRRAQVRLRALSVIENSRGARSGWECFTELMGTLATARGETPRAVEWRTPAGVVRATAGLAQRYPAACVEEFDGSPVRPLTAPRRPASAETRSPWPA